MTAAARDIGHELGLGFVGARAAPSRHERMERHRRIEKLVVEVLTAVNSTRRPSRQHNAHLRHFRSETNACLSEAVPSCAGDQSPGGRRASPVEPSDRQPKASGHIVVSRDAWIVPSAEHQYCPGLVLNEVGVAALDRAQTSYDGGADTR